ncbi:hypothetical protein SBRCBS47491_005402 [Sporothrix bragantina]|uniref:BZIP transcription factor n=1 Tax=Sporothrix bragantina TaxID=671064 RepID=A0ABP0BWE5_9PEZI
MVNKPDPAARRVENMTRSQIEHKRAIDRANQQICQRRKRARVQWLEGEVARLVTELDVAKARIRELEAGLPAATADDVDPVGSVVPVAPITTQTALPPPRKTSHPDAYDADNEETGPSAHAGDDHEAAWTAHLHEILDAGSYDNTLGIGSLMFEFPLPSPANIPTPLSPEAYAGGLPPWEALPLHLTPQTDIDHFYFEMINAARRLRAETTDADELTQARFPSISSLLNPNLGDNGSKPITSALATHVVLYSTIKPVTSRIAILYKLSLLLRWIVCRTRQSYERLPDFLKPTYLQRTVPHPAWVDAITWPAARDRIIASRVWEGESFAFDEFRRQTGSVSVNWPYTDSGAFLDVGGLDGEELVLSPMFEDHIRREENWSLSKSATTKFPFMKHKDPAVRGFKAGKQTA